MITELTVSTPGILPGDIVLVHGMRVRIDGPVHVFHHGCDDDRDRIRWTSGISPKPIEPPMRDGACCAVAYAWHGTVINVEEAVGYGVVPRSWMFDSERDALGPGHGREDFWNVQGNHRATWLVQREIPGEEAPDENA